MDSGLEVEMDLGLVVGGGLGLEREPGTDPSGLAVWMTLSICDGRTSGLTSGACDMVGCLG